MGKIGRGKRSVLISPGVRGIFVCRRREGGGKTFFTHWTDEEGERIPLSRTAVVKIYPLLSIGKEKKGGEEEFLSQMNRGRERKKLPSKGETTLGEEKGKEKKRELLFFSLGEKKGEEGEDESTLSRGSIPRSIASTSSVTEKKKKGGILFMGRKKERRN